MRGENRADGARERLPRPTVTLSWQRPDPACVGDGTPRALDTSSYPNPLIGPACGKRTAKVARHRHVVGRWTTIDVDLANGAIADVDGSRPRMLTSSPSPACQLGYDREPGNATSGWGFQLLRLSGGVDRLFLAMCSAIRSAATNIAAPRHDHDAAQYPGPAARADAGLRFCFFNPSRPCSDPRIREFVPGRVRVRPPCELRLSHCRADGHVLMIARNASQFPIASRPSPVGSWGRRGPYHGALRTHSALRHPPPRCDAGRSHRDFRAVRHGRHGAAARDRSRRFRLAGLNY